MEKYLKIALTASILIFVIAISYYSYDSYKNNFPNNDLSKNQELAGILKNDNSKSNDLNNDATSSSTPSFEGSSDGLSTGYFNENVSIPKNKTIPEDINTSNCGFYYSEYGICTGKCPEGKCISEERSCYCKK